MANPIPTTIEQNRRGSLSTVRGRIGKKDGQLAVHYRLLLCTQDAEPSPSVLAYSRYLCQLLDGQIAFVQLPPKHRLASLKAAAAHCDLMIFSEPRQAFFERLLAGRPGSKQAALAPTSVLITQSPRWPIKRILLIIRGDETDPAAVDWAGSFARSSGAAVTILPIVPTFPATASIGCCTATGLDDLLAANTTCGRQLRSLASQFVAWQVEGTLHFRQGDPEWQIHWEVTEGDYDLIVIGTEPHRGWRCWLLGDLVGPMLRWVTRPLLVARPGPDHLAE